MMMPRWEPGLKIEKERKIYLWKDIQHSMLGIDFSGSLDVQRCHQEMEILNILYRL